MPIPETREELEAVIRAKGLAGPKADRARELFAQREAALGKEPQPAGKLRQFVEGVAGGLAGPLDMVYRAAMATTPWAADMGAPPSMVPDTQPQGAAEGFSKAGGRVVGGLPWDLMTGGAGTATRGGRVALETLASGAQEGIGELLRQRGAPGWAQALAGMGAGGGMRGVTSLRSTPLGQRVREFSDPSVRTSAAEGIADRSLRDTIGERRMPEAMSRLAAEEAGGPYGTRLSTTQALSDVAPGMQTLERDVSRRVGDFGADMLDDRRRNIAQLQSHYTSTLARGGSADATAAALREARQSLQDSVDAAFAQADLAETFEISSDGVKTAVQSIRNQVAREGGFTGASMPSAVMDEIDRYRGAFSLSHLRGLQKRLTQEIFEAKDNPTRMRWLSMLSDQVEKEFDDVAAAGGDYAQGVNQLRKAIALRRQEGAFFNPRVKVSGQKTRVPNVVAQSFDKYEDPADAVRAIVRSPRPIENLERLRAIVGERPGAWEGVQAVVQRDKLKGLEDLFQSADSRVGAKAIDSMVAGLKKDHDAYNYVMGDTRATKNTIDFLERFKKAKTVGIAGLREETLSTGSGVAEDTVKKKWANARALVSVAHSGDLRGAASQLIAIAMPDHRPATYAEADRLITRALRDPAYGRWFLELRPRRELPKWREQVKKIIAPTAIRGANTATRPPPS